MDRSKTAYIKITTWVGRLSYASHFYCHIGFAGGEPDVEVRRNLTVEEARAINKSEKRKGRPDFQYKAGNSSGVYLTRSAALKEAARYFKKHLVPKGFTNLVDGNSYTLQPQPVVSAIKKFVPHKAAVNKLYRQAEKNDFWEGDEAVMEHIIRNWEIVMGAMNE